MQINKTTDYALRILICLGQENRTLSSSKIANNMRISQRYLLSIAKKSKRIFAIRFRSLRVCPVGTRYSLIATS